MEGERAVEEMRAVEHPVLARELVCYVGQAVAMVVANDRYAARDAADLVRVDYEPLAPLVDAVAGLDDGAALVHPDLGTNVGLRIIQEGGDVEAAFARASHRVSERFDVQRLAPAPIETRGVLARYAAEDDTLTVWSSTQEPHQLREHLAAAMNMPDDRVRVVAPDVGGGFGEKGCMFPEEFCIPYLAKQLGRPVKWIEDRQENMLAFHGRGYTVDVDAAVMEDGTIEGMRVRLVADLGAYFLISTPAIPPPRRPSSSRALQDPGGEGRRLRRFHQQAAHRRLPRGGRPGVRLLHRAHPGPDRQGPGYGPRGGAAEEPDTARRLPLRHPHRSHLRFRRLPASPGPGAGAFRVSLLEPEGCGAEPPTARWWEWAWRRWSKRRAAPAR